jgi:hypothetical protein
MRRWWSLLLVFLLPLQFTLAAAAAYCQHEAHPQAQHFGHHAHVHHEHHDAVDASQPAKAGQGAADLDCGVCHLSTAQPVSMQFALAAAVIAPDVPQAAIHPLRSRDPDRLERPDWRLA